MSDGLLKFQMSTWLGYGRRFGATAANIHDQALQERVARAMLDRGGRRNWLHCGEKVAGRVGRTPQASGSSLHLSPRFPILLGWSPSEMSRCAFQNVRDFAPFDKSSSLILSMNL